MRRTVPQRGSRRGQTPFHCSIVFVPQLTGFVWGKLGTIATKGAPSPSTHLLPRRTKACVARLDKEIIGLRFRFFVGVDRFPLGCLEGNAGPLGKALKFLPKDPPTMGLREFCQGNDAAVLSGDRQNNPRGLGKVALQHNLRRADFGLFARLDEVVTPLVERNVSRRDSDNRVLQHCRRDAGSPGMADFHRAPFGLEIALLCLASRRRRRGHGVVVLVAAAPAL